MRPCRIWIESGCKHCPYGELCRFQHPDASAVCNGFVGDASKESADAGEGSAVVGAAACPAPQAPQGSGLHRRPRPAAGFPRAADGPAPPPASYATSTHTGPQRRVVHPPAAPQVPAGPTGYPAAVGYAGYAAAGAYPAVGGSYAGYPAGVGYAGYAAAGGPYAAAGGPYAGYAAGAPGVAPTEQATPSLAMLNDWQQQRALYQMWQQQQMQMQAWQQQQQFNVWQQQPPSFDSGLYWQQQMAAQQHHAYLQLVASQQHVAQPVDARRTDARPAVAAEAQQQTQASAHVLAPQAVPPPQPGPAVPADQPAQAVSLAEAPSSPESPSAHGSSPAEAASADQLSWACDSSSSRPRTVDNEFFADDAHLLLDPDLEDLSGAVSVGGRGRGDSNACTSPRPCTCAAPYSEPPAQRCAPWCRRRTTKSLVCRCVQLCAEWM